LKGASKPSVGEKRKCEATDSDVSKRSKPAASTKLKGCTRCIRLDLIVSIESVARTCSCSLTLIELQCNQDQQCIKCTNAGEKCDYAQKSSSSTNASSSNTSPKRASSMEKPLTNASLNTLSVHATRAADQVIVANTLSPTGPGVETKSGDIKESPGTPTKACIQPRKLAKSAPSGSPLKNAPVSPVCDNCFREKMKVSQSHT
jgi:hypothetical protein